MKKNPAPKLFKLERFVRCGEMPMFLIFCRDMQGKHHHCIILCPARNLAKIRRLKEGFIPQDYGRMIYRGRGVNVNDVVRAMLKGRFNYELDLLTPPQR